MPRSGKHKTVSVYDSVPGEPRWLCDWSWSEARAAVARGDAEWGQVEFASGAFVVVPEDVAAPNSAVALSVRLLGDTPTPTWLLRPITGAASLDQAGNLLIAPLLAAREVVERALHDEMPGAISWHASSAPTPAPIYGAPGTVHTTIASAPASDQEAARQRGSLRREAFRAAIKVEAPNASPEQIHRLLQGLENGSVEGASNLARVRSLLHPC